MASINTVSVITICFNNLPDLIKTIESVDTQLQKPFEHLVIDGSTTDEIKNYLTNHPQAAYRRWISEPDEGISDAFNKGIINSTGSIVVMMNAGDTFYDANAVLHALKVFDQDPSIQWLHGKFKLFRGNQWIIIGKPFEKKKLYRGMRSMNHQSMFIKRSLHDRYGLYHPHQKLAMDYDFLCRIAHERFAFVPVPLATFAPNGVSSVNYPQLLKEIREACYKYLGKEPLLGFWQVRLRLLFYLLRTRMGSSVYKIMTALKLENI
jgi:glycosyltransferase involved in cell wall biosynthesis